MNTQRMNPVWSRLRARSHTYAVLSTSIHGWLLGFCKANEGGAIKLPRPTLTLSARSG
jgi:hypothetical protein